MTKWTLLYTTATGGGLIKLCVLAEQKCRLLHLWADVGAAVSSIEKQVCIGCETSRLPGEWMSGHSLSCFRTSCPLRSLGGPWSSDPWCLHGWALEIRLFHTGAWPDDDGSEMFIGSCMQAELEQHCQQGDENSVGESVSQAIFYFVFNGKYIGWDWQTVFMLTHYW